jgi:Icc-related predicted phosphoesterase
MERTRPWPFARAHTQAVLFRHAPVVVAVAAWARRRGDRMIRLAAVGDIHVAGETAEMWRERLAGVNEDADLLVIAGDLTRHGSAEEAEALAHALGRIEIPFVAVLGNHDYQADLESAVIGAVERRGGRVLEGDSAVIAIGDARVGIAGTKGFGGGFVGACATEFGEPATKAFVRHTREMADRLRASLEALDADLRIALLHYAPIPETLDGERREIYPFLGSYLLAEAVDAAGADLVVHGHAHGGVEKGWTAGGIRVRNVAEPVIRSAYRVYCFGGECTAHRAPVERFADF